MIPPDLLGTILDGRFELAQFLGRGSFAWVYESKDLTTGDAVAVKLLTPGAPTHHQAELENEGRLLERLSGARNVVDLIGPAINQASLAAMLPNGVATAVPLHFLVLELMDGSLADLLGQRAAFSWVERLRLLRDVVSGAHQMHQHSIFHRDIKSDNVLLRAQQKTAVAKLGDLGRSKDCSTRTPSPFSYELGRGDFRFAPPEFLWALGTSSPACFRAADLYLLGSVLFELATGQTLTSLVFPDPHRWIGYAMGMRPEDRHGDFQGRLSEIRDRYELPWELMADELPLVIRDEAMILVRQLCDPDSLMRTRRTGQERNLAPTDLQWLLRRVDIMSARIRVAHRHSVKYEKAGKAKGVSS